jgi:hypothetical protein
VGAAFTIAGLIFNIAGAVLLYFFGLPATISSEGHDYLMADQTNSVEMQRARLYDRLGRLGIGLLLMGFGLRLSGALAGVRRGSA